MTQEEYQELANQARKTQWNILWGDYIEYCHAQESPFNSVKEAWESYGRYCQQQQQESLNSIKENT